MFYIFLNLTFIESSLYQVSCLSGLWLVVYVKPEQEEEKNYFQFKTFPGSIIYPFCVVDQKDIFYNSKLSFARNIPEDAQDVR